MKVHLLYTIRNGHLTEYAELVFKTIRTGFPTAQIIVHINGRPHGGGPKESGIEYRNSAPTIHHDWITCLIEAEPNPFWICDTDMIFWESVENWKFDQPLAGRRIPQWMDEFTNCITRPRLHTSLMYIDPAGVTDRLEKYKAQFPETPFNPFPNLINPLCVPLKGKTYFYDTTAMLYNAIGGQPFTERQLNSFDHLNFGSISDIVLPRLKDGERMRILRDAITRDNSLAKGLWRIQEKYYADRQS